MTRPNAQPDDGGATPPSDEAARRRAVRAWCLYDWANSAFATSVLAAILPPFFASVAERTLPPHLATAYWGYASSAGMLLAAFAGPVLGASADHLGRKKPLLAGCVAVGAVTTLLLAAVPNLSWLALLLLFGLAFVAFASGNVLYDSLLPAVARPAEMHRVSARGFAYGYFGGGLLLALNLAWILAPHRFGLRDATAATRLSFASVAVWWAVFSVPLLRHVPEPHTPIDPTPVLKLPSAVARRLVRTMQEIRRQPDLLRFLIAFWLYSDGIGTIIKMAAIYGSEVGIGKADLIGALLMVQIVAAPASLAFGRLAQPLGPKRAVAIGLLGYAGISVFAFFLARPWHFWVLAALVAIFQGGTQALSRSIFVSLVPRSRTGELFGFYSVSEKLAGVVGPLVFGVVTQFSGAGRYAVLTLLPFFLVGAWLLVTVDLERGATAARAHG
jgi:UMF1 family MFS transporter